MEKINKNEINSTSHSFEINNNSILNSSNSSNNSTSISSNSNDDNNNNNNNNEDSKGFTLAALYCFTKHSNLEEVYNYLKQLCLDNHILGGLIIANEGLNGTIAGRKENIENISKYLKEDSKYTDIDIKYSYSEHQPFHRLRIQIKNEIVTLGIDGVDPTINRGAYVHPEEWNDLISDPNTIVFDTRNDYEVSIGTFRGAINPKTKVFSEFPYYIQTELHNRIINEGKLPRIAMFCTGGIRCEKASSYLKNLGFPEVYHLKGGILNYLEHIPKEKSLWEGECYVFDDRVSVTHGVETGTYIQCRGCRMPLSQEDIINTKNNNNNNDNDDDDDNDNEPYYEEGVCCKYCYHTLTKQQKEAARERHKQMLLAKERNTQHLGYNPVKERQPKRQKYNYRKLQNQILQKSFQNIEKNSSDQESTLINNDSYNDNNDNDEEIVASLFLDPNNDEEKEDY